MSSDNTLYCSDFIPLERGKKYALAASFIGHGVSGSAGKDLVAVFELFGADKSRLDIPVPGLSFSQKYGGHFIYLPTAAAGDKDFIHQGLVFPAQAKYVVLRVYKWAFTGETTYLHPPLLEAQKDEGPVFNPENKLLDKEVCYESEYIDIIEADYQLFTYFRAGGKAAADEKSLCAVYRFFDASGMVIDEPGDGLFLSETYGPYHYIDLRSSSVQKGPAIHPPAGAVQAKILILPWKYTGPVLGQEAARLMRRLGSGSLAVAAGQNFIFSIRDGVKACFVNVDFIGANKQILAPAAPFAPHPLFLGAVREFLSAPGEEAGATLSFTVPEKAEKLEYNLYCCDTGEAIDAASVSLEQERRVLPGQTQWIDMPVRPYFSHQLRLDFSCGNADSPAPILGLSFMDKKGLPCFIQKSVTCEQGLMRSFAQLGQFFEFTPERVGPAAYEARITLPAHPDVRVLRLCLINAGYEDLEYEPKLSIQDFFEDAACESFSEQDSIQDVADFISGQVWEKYFSFRIRAALEKADGKQLGVLLGFCARNGHVRMGGVVARALVNSPHQNWAAYKSAKRMLGEELELSPGWLPEIPGPAQEPRHRAGGPIRVAHFFKTVMPLEYTGGSIRCAAIAAYQKKSGLEPLALTPLGYAGPSDDGGIYAAVEYGGVTHYHIVPMSLKQAVAMPPDKALVADSILACELLKDKDIDIIQASSGYRGYDAALKGLAVARKLGVPFVYEVRSFHEHTWNSDNAVLDMEKTRLRLAKEDFCMLAADAVVTICETMKLELLRRGVPEQKIQIVPNCVDPEHFRPDDPALARDAADLKSRLGIGDKRVIGYISNLSAREGHEVLLRAFAGIRRENPDLACVLVGEGPELERLRRLCKTLRLDDAVVFAGKVPHACITSYYAMMDLFIVPRIEDYAGDFVTPMKPLEAMALKRPIIASDRPALSELLQDGERGLLFESGNARQLGGLIVRAFANPEEMAEKAAKAQAWVMSQRTWEKNIEVYKNLYAALLKKRGGA